MEDFKTLVKHATVFVCTPYSSTSEELKNLRFKRASWACGYIMVNGGIPLSPVVQGVPIAKEMTLPDDYAYWKEYCIKMIGMCDFVIVLTQHGWDKSTGVAGEIKAAHQLGKRVFLVHLEADEIEIYSELEKPVFDRTEYILCAANHYDDGIEHHHTPSNIKTGFITCGHRHHNCISIFAQIVGFPYNEDGLKLIRSEEQGFLTNTNRFVNRKEAMKIAVLAGQVEYDKIHSPKIGLHSEDLY